MKESQEVKKMIFIIVEKKGVQILKKPVRSMEMIVGSSQFVDEETRVILCCEEVPDA